MSGNGRIITREGGAPRDVHGRLLSRPATVEEVYKIVADETAKVHEYYLNQIPVFCARMIQDALIEYKLIAIPAGPTEPPEAETPAEVPA